MDALCLEIDATHVPLMSSLLVGRGGAALTAWSVIVDVVRVVYCLVYMQGRRGPGGDIGVRDQVVMTVDLIV